MEIDFGDTPTSLIVNVIPSEYGFNVFFDCGHAVTCCIEAAPEIGERMPCGVCMFLVQNTAQRDLHTAPIIP
jgi:hypothetical protein